MPEIIRHLQWIHRHLWWIRQRAQLRAKPFDTQQGVELLAKVSRELEYCRKLLQ